ncbi:unnamed protein product [Moneuplotes crassus]|uniref:Uncharacterized protein n=1 Tax=Euplotes crassus TaxID=5936 RepID=A0AAD1XB74_EUPCR|nr:unnamed protein product [Moneuplotes crassus]
MDPTSPPRNLATGDRLIIFGSFVILALFCCCIILLAIKQYFCSFIDVKTPRGIKILSVVRLDNLRDQVSHSSIDFELNLSPAHRAISPNTPLRRPQRGDKQRVRGFSSPLTPQTRNYRVDL